MANIEFDLSIKLSNKLENKLRWLLAKYTTEISGWLVGKVDNDVLEINDILIPEQEVSSATVDTDGKSLIKLRKEYGDRCLGIIGHWHSHNTMGTFWSSTDNDFIKEFMDKREKGVFMVSSLNKRHLIRLEIRGPIGISINELDYDIEQDYLNIDAEMKRELNNKIKEKKYTTTTICDWGDWGKYTRSDEVQINRVKEDKEEKKVLNEFLKKSVYYDFNKREVVVSVEDESVLCSIFYKFGIANTCYEDFDNSTIKISVKTNEEAYKLIKDIREYIKEELEIMNTCNEWDLD